jgi:hypothetical protein
MNELGRRFNFLGPLSKAGGAGAAFLRPDLEAR